MYSDDLANLIESKIGWKRAERYPSFLKKYKWVPTLVFSKPGSNLFIAVDIIFKQSFPKKIYQTEVTKALNNNSLLRFCLFTPDLEFDILSQYCKKNNIGLKIYSVSSINTLVPFLGEKVENVTRKKSRRTGWFPQVILEEVKKVKNIHFAKLVVELAKKLEKNPQQSKQFDLIRKYVAKIMKADPSYVGSNIPLMNLSSFENILKNSHNKCNDHVFHSVRVFLIGCIIIDRFYDEFINSYKEILGRNVNVEYIWLLASIFHDIGRIQQHAYRVFYLGDSNKDDQGLRDAIEESQKKKWQDDVYKRVLGNLVELIKQCSTKKYRDRPFIGYALGGVIDPQIANILKEHYNKLTSHGVISCFELSTDLLRKIDATTEKHSKVFFLYHLFPAALAIAFHDWKIWKDLSDIKIFPINIKDHPLAALLIYIDTWDDYKRGQDEKITIDKIYFSNKEVTVYLTWHKQNEYLEEKLKYDSFERNVLFEEIRLKIEVSNKKQIQ